MILKLEQAQFFVNTLMLKSCWKTLIEAWDVVKSENVLLDPNSEL